LHEMCTKERVAQMGANDVQADPRAEERRMPRPVPGLVAVWCGRWGLG
jgi:hypothetical protein